MRYKFLFSLSLVIRFAAALLSPGYANTKDLGIRGSGHDQEPEGFSFPHSALYEDYASSGIYTRTSDEERKKKIPTDVYFPPSDSLKSQDMPSLLRQSSTLSRASLKSNHEQSSGHSWPLPDLQGKQSFPIQESGQLSRQDSIEPVPPRPKTSKPPKRRKDRGQTSSQKNVKTQKDSKFRKLIEYCRKKMKGASSAADTKGTELAGADLTCGPLLSGALLGNSNGGSRKSNNGDRMAEAAKDKKQKKSAWYDAFFQEWNFEHGGM